jgi:hypothetical protein
MQDKNTDDNAKVCNDKECFFSSRSHEHVKTNRGGYVRYLDDIKQKEIDNANPSR